ncbi:MAG: hypothetical protein ACRCW5_10940 [Cetobacterium sp.]|uniref:hypothetical protein n=1 Tax=Cetobacterium sp. TaxID=2071632 RepID=UPI003F393E30
MSGIYLYDWNKNELEGMCSDFCIKQDTLDDVEILIAAYVYEDYDGSAFVLFKRDGKLYEVNGSHCSCYGLECQWEPEETTVEALMKRYQKKPYWAGEDFIEKLHAILDEHKAAK